MKKTLFVALMIVAGFAQAETPNDICYGAYGPNVYHTDGTGAEDAVRLKQCLASVVDASRRAKLPGVSIGMTADQVINKSSWGRPGSVSRTTTAAGTREQWVYGGSNYLYFTNGVLTAIQN